MDIGMVSKWPPHPAHVGFGEAVGADRIDIDPVGPSGSSIEDLITAFSFRHISKHRIYILEDASALYGAPFLARRSDPTIILLATSHRTTMQGYEFDLRKRPIETVRWLDRRVDIACLQRIARRYVDGVIANSELSAASIRRLAPELPVRVVEPYVQPSVYDRLQSVETSFDEPTVVFVGKAREHKGLDLLIEAWPEIRRRVPGASLELVGRDHDSAHGRVEGVTVRGYVDRLDEVFEDSSLYVHPARYEPWGVAPVEAMLAGVPPIVTDRTGIASLVSRIDERLVVSPDPAELAETVGWYFETPDELKRRFSARARELARPYDEKTQTRAFIDEFDGLLDSVG